MRNCYARMAVARLHTYINCAISRHSDRVVVGALCGRSGDWPDAPRKAIILGHDDGLLTIHVAYQVRSSARVVGHVSRPVGSNFNMAVQSTAVDSGKDRYCRAKGDPAVEAERASCIRHALRAIVDSMRVNRTCQRRVKWATTNCLVVDTRGCSPLTWRESGAVIVSDVDSTACRRQSFELRR